MDRRVPPGRSENEERFAERTKWSGGPFRATNARSAAKGAAARYEGYPVSKERLYIFDTTLRDGAQTQSVDFSVEDKRQIALALDGLGIDYIEGGWPGANPT